MGWAYQKTADDQEETKTNPTSRRESQVNLKDLMMNIVDDV
jgi:hypothetical protein